MSRKSRHSNQRHAADIGIPLGPERSRRESESNEDVFQSRKTHVRRRSAKRDVNYKFLIVGLLLCVLLIGSVYGIHAWQMRRLKNDLLVQARHHREVGENSLAIRYLQQYLALAPDDIDALVESTELLGQEATTARQILQAFLACERCLQLDETRDSVRRSAGLFAMRIGRYAEAMHHFKILDQRTEADAELQLNLGICHQAMKEQPQAIEAFRKAIELDPKDARPYQRLAALYGSDDTQYRDPEGLRSLMEQLVKANPDDYQGYLIRARYRLQDGDRAGAGEDLLTAMEKAPERVEPVVAAANLAMIDEKRTGLFLKDLAGQMVEMIRIHPTDLSLSQTLTLFELTAGTPQKAIEWATKGLDLNPKDPDLGTLLAFAQIRESRFEEADKLIRQLPAWGVSSTMVTALSGFDAAAREQWSDASRRLASVIREIPSDMLFAAEAGRVLSDCYRMLNDPEAELALCDTLIERGITTGSAHARRAQLLADQGKVNEAISEYQQINTSPGIALELAKLLIRQNQLKSPSAQNWTAAQAALDAAEQETPDSPEIPLLRASMLLAMGKPADARTVLESAQEKYPEEVRVPVTLAVISEQAADASSVETKLDEIEARFGHQPIIWDTRLALVLRRREPETAAKLEAVAVRLAALSESDRFSRHLRLGSAWELIDRFPDAQSQYEMAVALRPGRVDALQRLLRSVFQNRDDEKSQEVIAALRKVEGEEGLNWRSGEVTRLLQLVQAGQPEHLQQARSQIQEIERRRPNWPPLLVHEALLAEIEHRPDDAIAKYSSVVDLGQASPAAIERLVMLLYQTERIEEAAAVLRTEENRTATSAFDAGNLLGLATIVAMRGEDSQRVLTLAERRVAAYPKDYRSHTWLGQVLVSEKRFEEAEREFRTAIELDGAADLPWVNLTALLVRQGKRDAAQAVFDQLRSRESPALLTVAKCADALGDPNAAASYEAALAAAPDNTQLLQQVIMFYLRNEYPGRSEQLLRKLIKDEARTSIDQRCWGRLRLASLLTSGRGIAGYREARALLDQNLQDRQAQQLGQKAIGNFVARELLMDLRAQLALLASRPHTEDLPQAEKLMNDIARVGSRTPNDYILFAQILDGVKGQEAEARIRWQWLNNEHGDNPDVMAAYVRRMISRGEATLRDIERLEEVVGESFATVELKTRFAVNAGNTELATESIETYVRHAENEDMRIVRMRQAVAFLHNLLHSAASSSVTAITRQKLDALADDYLRRLVEYSPDSVLQQAAFLIAEKRIDEALTHLENAEEQLGPIAAAHVGAQLLSSASRTEQDIARLSSLVERSLQKLPQSEDLLVQLGLIREHQGRYQEAVGLYQKALGLNGSNVLALNNLAWMYAVGGGDPALGKKLMQRAIELTGRNPLLLETMTAVLIANQEYDQALKVLEEAIEDERTPSRLFYLAQLHFKSGNIPLARSALAETIAAGLVIENLHPIEQQQFRELNEVLSKTRSADPAAR